jgi:hypothetical protein
VNPGPLGACNVLENMFAIGALAKRRLGLGLVETEPSGNGEQVLQREALGAGQEQRMRLPEAPAVPQRARRAPRRDRPRDEARNPESGARPSSGCRSAPIATSPGGSRRNRRGSRSPRTQPASARALRRRGRDRRLRPGPAPWRPSSPPAYRATGVRMPPRTKASVIELVPPMWPRPRGGPVSQLTVAVRLISPSVTS